MISDSVRVIAPWTSAALAVLGASALCATQDASRPDNVPSEVHEHFTSQSDEGESAEIFLDRNTESKQVVAAFFSGPTSLLSEQGQPWGRLQEMPELAELQLHMATIDSDVLAFAATLPALERLIITECVLEEPLRLEHAVLKRLKDLQFEFGQEDAVHWEFLRRMPALQRLEVWGVPVSPQLGEQFREMKRLVDLKCIVDDGSAPQIFARLADLPSTITLTIHRMPGGGARLNDDPKSKRAPSGPQSTAPCAGESEKAP